MPPTARDLPFRESYRAVPLYSPGVERCAIDLSDNTNLWGPPPAARHAVAASPDAALSRYPALYSHGIKALVAGYAGVAPDEIVTGCGSDDVIDSAIRALAEPGDAIAHPAPSFSMIPTFARMSGVEPIAVPLRAGSWDVDAAALLATGARIIYLCSPNNPTGTVASREAILEVVAGAPGFVILDEAYAEFADEAFVARAPGWGRVLVTRTMSKAFGLAGLRFGYGAGSAALVREVEKARGPYTVSAVAERAVAAALTEDLPWVRRHARLARENRDRFAAELRRLGLCVLPSAANFVMIRTERASEIARRMAQAGIAVRLLTGLPVVGDALRVGIGPWGTMAEALDAIERVGLA
ncbi:MAG: pyridoxal phosphate-dependent aminotransferase [Gemmatimonadaceae bacterium]